MKWLIAVLIVANVALFGFNLLQPPAAPASAPVHEVNASQLKVVTGELANRPQAPKVASAASAVASQVAAVATPAPTPAPTLAPAPTAIPKPTPAPTPVAVARSCSRWTGLTGDQAGIARARLAILKVSNTEQNSSPNSKVWVYIPPLPDLATAKQRADQLAALNVDDYFVVNNGGKWQNAISLGIYSTREAGERRMEELRTKGVHSMVLRDKDDTLRHSSFILTGMNDQQRAGIEKTAGQLKGSVLEKMACP
ncbi:hypothetical protein JCM19000A_08930 [Silvimonas sp. JCM 19000]